MLYCERCTTPLVDDKFCPGEKDGKKCGFIRFQNAISVPVAIVQVAQEDGTLCLLGIKRGVAPFIGENAFPGGFQEIERVKTALVRELEEETGLVLEESDFPDMGIVRSSEPNPNRNLIFFKCKKIISYKDINWNFVGNEGERVVRIHPDTKLCFPIHQQMVAFGFNKE